MSLRSVGTQLLQTVPSLLLDGAATASASFWIQINPANDVVAANGVEVFGDAGGKFSAAVSSTGGLRLQWSSNDGHATSVSSCSLGLTPGTSYHLAATWQSGSQRYYLDGIEVEVDTKAGTLGVLGDASPHPFRLGSDQAGADVTLDQPTLWVGYALTAKDVVALRDRTAQPSAIAPASIALAWSLAGSAGATVKVGDAGLVDSSPSGLALSSIVGTAPTYQAADLAYVAVPTFGQAVVAPSGKSIVLLAQDGHGNSTGITSIQSSNAVQTIELVGTPAKNAFTLSFNGQATAPIPTTTNPPAKYFLWTVPTVVGHSYQIAVNFFTVDHDLTGVTYFYETMEAGAVVATGTRTGPEPTSIFTDPGVNTAAGPAAPWFPVNAGITATSTSLQLRCTAEGYYAIRMSALRVQDTTAGTITYYQVSEQANVAIAPAGGFAYQPAVNSYGGNEYYSYGANTGIGPVIQITPGSSTAAEVLQAALSALPSVGPEGLTVDDNSGTGTGSYQINFAANLGNAAQPAIACADAAVAISVVAPGGTGPTISINGGTPSLLGNWVWTSGLPYAICPLYQSAPAARTAIVGMLPYAISNYWDGQVPVPSSLSGAPTFGYSAGLTMTFTFAELPPGTYQFAITYPNAPFTFNQNPYTPSTEAPFTVQDGTGATLASYVVDQTQAPADYQADGQGWKILGSVRTTTLGTLTLVMSTGVQPVSPAGSAKAVSILDAVQICRTSPDESIVVGPTDVVTLDIPAGWATTQAGAVPALPGIPAAPPSPTNILPPFVAGPKTMKVGYNIEPANYYGTVITHSNLAYLIGTGMAPDANGWATRFVSPSYSPGSVTSPIIIAGSQPQLADPPQGSFVINDGLYLMMWDGDETMSLYPGLYTTMVEETQYRVLTGTTGNRRVYRITHDSTRIASPSFSQNVASSTQDLVMDPTGNTYVLNLKNLQIYPPDPSDPTGNTIWGLNTQTGAFTPPPKFHPWFLYKLQGMQSVRFLDVLNTNKNPAYSYAHFKVATHANRCSPSNATDSFAIATIGPTDPGYSFVASSSPMIKITTVNPHGLYGGCQINFAGCGTAMFGSTPVTLDQAVGIIYDVPSATTAICQLQLTTNPTVMSNSLTGGLVLTENTGTCWPLQDIVDLMEAVPTLTDLHFNVPASIDVTPGGGAEQVADFLAANLKPGARVHVEFGNECWNYFFLTHLWSAMQQSKITGSYNGYEIFFADQTKAVHDRFMTAFTAAGRPGDVVHLYGAFAGDTDNTTQILQQAQANGATVDEVCVAVYFSVTPAAGYGGFQVPIFDAMTPDQWLDYMELNAVYGGYPAELVANQYPVLEQFGYNSAKVIAYEGSPSNLVALDNPDSPAPGTTPDFSIRQNTVRRHPRMYGVILQMAQAFQDAGLAMWSWFHIGGSGSFNTWDMFEYGNQLRGTGDPTLDLVNVNNPIVGKNQTLNEQAGAWHYWSTLSAPATTVITTKNTLVPGRNGMLKAIGFPRGMNRLSRAR